MPVRQAARLPGTGHRAPGTGHALPSDRRPAPSDRRKNGWKMRQVPRSRDHSPLHGVPGRQALGEKILPVPAHRLGSLASVSSARRQEPPVNPNTTTLAPTTPHSPNTSQAKDLPCRST
ncbi:hypothetical protein BX667DRAFT_518833 [Coemansia mojavensis]|nr:hypothetical protein BX667DRAFT_518833 [Coemansia mojavensis]